MKAQKSLEFDFAAGIEARSDAEKRLRKAATKASLSELRRHGEKLQKEVPCIERALSKAGARGKTPK